MDLFDRSRLGDILVHIKEGAAQANERLQEKIAEVRKKRRYIRVETPVQWAQSLSYVFIEVRYAHRHDAPGCSRSEDESVTILADRIQLSVFCVEATSRVQYHLELPLWEEIDVSRSSYSYQTVGKQHFTLAKKRAPGRWL